MYLSQCSKFCCFNKQLPHLSEEQKIILQQQKLFITGTTHQPCQLGPPFCIILTLSPGLEQALDRTLPGCHGQTTDSSGGPYTGKHRVSPKSDTHAFHSLAGNNIWPHLTTSEPGISLLIPESRVPTIFKITLMILEQLLNSGILKSWFAEMWGGLFQRKRNCVLLVLRA